MTTEPGHPPGRKVEIEGGAGRARAGYTLSGGDGATTREGEAEAAAGADALEVGPVRVPWLDADALMVGDHRLEIAIWPSGRLVLTGMGRRHDAFLQELRRARNRGRIAGLLAHGITEPETFDASVAEASAAPRPAEVLIYDTHVTLAPHDGDPFQIPFGAVTRVRVVDDPHGVTLDTAAGATTLTQLGRLRDARRDAIQARLDAHALRLHEITGQDGFADGWGVPRSRALDFDGLRERYTSSSRSSCAAALLATASGEPRIGFVQLLDPDGEALASPTALPERWAAFLLVPMGEITALEILAGPAAATYLFRAPVDAVNRDLQLMHFRRAPLALSDEEAALGPMQPHRLALRRLEPLRRLRASTVARLIHREGWEEALRGALR